MMVIFYLSMYLFSKTIICSLLLLQIYEQLMNLDPFFNKEVCNRPMITALLQTSLFFKH